MVIDARDHFGADVDTQLNTKAHQSYMAELLLRQAAILLI